MLRNTTVDSAMPLSLVSWPFAMRPEATTGSVVYGGAQSALSGTARLECSSGSRREIVIAGVVKGGIRPVAADLPEQPFGIHLDGGPSGTALMALNRDHESAFVSKVTYGRSHDPAVRRRRGEG